MIDSFILSGGTQEGVGSVAAAVVVSLAERRYIAMHLGDEHQGLTLQRTNQPATDLAPDEVDVLTALFGGSDTYGEEFVLWGHEQRRHVMSLSRYSLVTLSRHWGRVQLTRTSSPATEVNRSEESLLRSLFGGLEAHGTTVDLWHHCLRGMHPFFAARRRLVKAGYVYRLHPAQARNRLLIATAVLVFTVTIIGWTVDFSTGFRAGGLTAVIALSVFIPLFLSKKEVFLTNEGRNRSKGKLMSESLSANVRKVLNWIPPAERHRLGWYEGQWLGGTASNTDQDRIAEILVNAFRLSDTSEPNDSPLEFDETNSDSVTPGDTDSSTD